MVFCREGQPERAPLSRILPQLYLGAETDITQDCLSARGISYVLSVSRCCPQPSFLPQSHYLRIPIDDSLRDDLLAWIPEALRFIDGAMSLGCSVIVHCAAGISRSPALAVAYVMYSLGMDLDHAYRFVKERRPTISPNFNFLGQLQLFQGTLSLKSSTADQPAEQPLGSSDSDSDSSSRSTSGPRHVQDNVTDNNHNIAVKGDTKADTHCENKNSQRDSVLTPNPRPEFTLSLTDKLKTLSVEPNEVPAPTQQDLQTPKWPKPTHLQIPSLSEKRKSLTLSLTPVCPSPRTEHREENVVNVCNQEEACRSPAVRNWASRGSGKSRRREFTPNGAQSRDASSVSQKRREKSERRSCSRAKHEQPEAKPGLQRGKADCHSSGSAARHQQGATGCAVEAVEVPDAAQSPLSPVNLTINRLLGWGERMLLGVLLGPHIKIGQAALPYRC